ncbi:MAG: T9SS type A sorting domain-containing protein [candidate division Zixibacteria bacterium]|nr:T9SS type A sorting domain-containing protein [candidate division Zixibacteria bacterium]
MNYVNSILVSIIALSILICNANSATDITFSDPLILETTADFYLTESFKESVEVNGYKVGSSDKCLLVIYEVMNADIQYMVRVDTTGLIIDTVPHSYRTYEEAKGNLSGFVIQAITWESPYFYIWEMRDNLVHYTRIDGSLSKVDHEPVQLFYHPPSGWGHTNKLVFDGSKVWSIDEQDSFDISLYQAGNTEPLLKDVRLSIDISITYFAEASQGLYMAIVETGGAVIYRVFIDENGQVTYPGQMSDSEFDSQYTWCGAYIPGSDTMYVYWISKTEDEKKALTYYRVSVSNGENDGTIQVTLPLDSTYRYTGYYGCFFHDGLLTVLSRINIAGDRHVIFHTINPADSSVVNYGLLDHQYYRDTYFLYQDNQPNIGEYLLWGENKSLKLVSLNMDALIEPHITNPLNFMSSKSSEVSLACDADGLLAYTRLDDSGNAYVRGYRIPNGSPFEIESEFTVFDDTARILRSHVLHAAGFNVFYWHLNLYENVYEQKCVFFNGNTPSIHEIANAIVIDTSNGHGSKPSFIESDSLLYINFLDSRYHGYFWTNGSSTKIRGIDLINSQLTDLDIVITTNGSSAVVHENDTFFCISSNIYCSEQTGTFPICTEFLGWYDMDIAVNGQLVDNFSLSNYLTSARSGMIDIRSRNINGENIILDSQDFFLKRLNDNRDGLDIVCNPIDYCSDVVSHQVASDFVTELIETSEYITLMMFNKEDFGGNNTILILDKEWNYIAHHPIPLTGFVQDVTGFSYSDVTDEIFIGYESYFGLPYASVKSVLQSIQIRNITSNDDNDPSNMIFNLNQNYPNPFNPFTKIEFTLDQQSSVSVEIFNIVGQKMKALIDDILPAGNHSIVWDGTDGSGDAVASGIYLYRLTSNNKTSTKKMILVK